MEDMKALRAKYKAAKEAGDEKAMKSLAKKIRGAKSSKKVKEHKNKDIYEKVTDALKGKEPEYEEADRPAETFTGTY